LFITALYVSQEWPSSLIIGVCRIGLLYLIHHTLFTRVLLVRFEAHDYATHYVFSVCCYWAIAQCRDSEHLDLYILCVLKC